MPCVKGTRYPHVAYLSVEEFFARSSHDHCLAPNLDPHPTKESFERDLLSLQSEPGVEKCIIPVMEYEEPSHERDPYSDRVFVVGRAAEQVVERWAKQLRAEHYREERAGAEMPRGHSSGQGGWFLVWD